MRKHCFREKDLEQIAVLDALFYRRFKTRSALLMISRDQMVTDPV